MNILLLEDDEYDAELVVATLKRSGLQFEIRVVGDKKEFLDAIEALKPDVILSDNSLPQFSAVIAKRLLNEKKLDIPFILVTGTTSDEFAVEIMKEGAADYVLKDRLSRLPSAISQAVHHHQHKIEQQRYLEQVIKNEALMKLSESLAQFGIWEVDRTLGLYHWSDEYYRILGYEVGSVSPKGEYFFAKVHPEDLDFVRQTINIAMLKLQQYEFECRIVPEPGVIKYIHNKININRDHENNVNHIYGFAMDITQRRLAEVSAAKSELNYKRVLDNIMDGLMLDDVDGKLVYANDQFLKIFGYSKDEASKLSIEDYVHPDFRTQIREQHNNRIKGLKAPTIFEFQGIRSDGEKIWVEVRVSKVIEHGRIAGTQAALRDVTAAKVAEELRQQSEANLKAIFDNTDIGFVLLDTNLKIKSYNHYFGRFASEILERKIYTGKHLSIYFKDDKHDAVNSALQQALKKESSEHESEFAGSEQQKKWFSLSYNAIINQNNDVLGVLVTLRDITQKKNMILEEKRIKNELIRRINDLEQFAYIISHNLRAPVANILGLTSLITERLTADDEFYNLINSLSDASNKMDVVLNDINKILTINKDISENKELTNLSQLTESICGLLSKNAQMPRFIITTDYMAINEIYTIRSYIHSIYLNLISNSIKYRKEHEEPVINIATKLKGNNIQIIFKDNGIGIDMERFGKKVFRLYNRFHMHVEGRGIGLYMVKSQVELLGGTIILNSAPNQGCEMIVELPIN